MNAVVDKFYKAGPLASRIACAILGGYVLAALSSVAVLALPVSQAQGVIAGMLISFVVFAGTVIWVFAVGSARRAWSGWLIAVVPLALAAGSVWLGAHVS
jgi:hypothetical protein